MLIRSDSGWEQARVSLAPEEYGHAPTKKRKDGVFIHGNCAFLFFFLVIFKNIISDSFLFFSPVMLHLNILDDEDLMMSSVRTEADLMISFTHTHTHAITLMV